MVFNTVNSPSRETMGNFWGKLSNTTLKKGYRFLASEHRTEGLKLDGFVVLMLCLCLSPHLPAQGWSFWPWPSAGCPTRSGESWLPPDPSTTGPGPTSRRTWSCSHSRTPSSTWARSSTRCCTTCPRASSGRCSGRCCAAAWPCSTPTRSGACAAWPPRPRPPPPTAPAPAARSSAWLPGAVPLPGQLTRFS